MTLSVFIADDEHFAREEIKHQLSGYSVNILGEADNGIEAVKNIKELKPDLIFLDIEMPGLKGVEIAAVLSSLDSYNPFVIIISAYSNYALEAFEYNVSDYLLKPINVKRFSSAMQRVLKYYESSGSRKNRISAKRGNRIFLIPEDEISYVFVDNSVVNINSSGKIYSTTYRTLDELEKDLQFSNFFRTHRAYLVNVDKVREMRQIASGAMMLKLIDLDDFEVPVSRSKTKELKLFLNIKGG